MGEATVIFPVLLTKPFFLHILGSDAKANTGELEALQSPHCTGLAEDFIQHDWVKQAASVQVSTTPRRNVLPSL